MYSIVCRSGPSLHPGRLHTQAPSFRHQLAEAQIDLATVRDAMEATDEALARKEQEAAYMWSTVKSECCAGAPRWGGFWGVWGACLCV